MACPSSGPVRALWGTGAQMEPVPQLGPQHFASWGQGWGGSSCSLRPPPWGLGRGLSGVNPCCPRKKPNLSPPPVPPAVQVVSFLLAPPLPHAGPERGLGLRSVSLSQLPQESVLQCSEVPLLENRPGLVLTGTVSAGASRGSSARARGGEGEVAWGLPVLL